MWLRTLRGAKIMKEFRKKLMRYRHDTKGLEKYGVEISTLEFIIKESTEISAENAVIYNNFGCFYAEKKDREAAIRMLNKAIQMCKKIDDEKMLDTIQENKRNVQELL